MGCVLRSLSLSFATAFALVSPLATRSLSRATTMTDTDAMRTQQSTALMQRFSERTGLTHPGVSLPVRYLWTDAFALCNFLSLARTAHTTEGREEWLSLAERLIDQVHCSLGKHRPDDETRAGWISGLSDEDGAAHPTIAGLRIGKKRPERAAHEAASERLEWEQDGQYLHYSTKWMHALAQTATQMHAFEDADDTHTHTHAHTEEEMLRWACELASATVKGFLARSSPPRLYWKMSIDLSRPLVASMGQHDALDGWLTLLMLQTVTSTQTHKQALTHSQSAPLQDELNTLHEVMRTQGSQWFTEDALGLGMLLVDLHRALQLRTLGAALDASVIDKLITATSLGLREYSERKEGLCEPAEYRLAFRELGLSIGLRAVEMLPSLLRDNPEVVSADRRERIESLQRFLYLIEDIENFWLQSAHQRTRSWREHQDINEVMLATSLRPEGFLIIATP